jgi:hypothetical protein
VHWDSDAGARQFVDRHRLPFPVGRDGGAAIGTPYGVDATPASMFIDRNGILVEQKTGGMDEGEFEQRIGKLLGKT